MAVPANVIGNLQGAVGAGAALLATAVAELYVCNVKKNSDNVSRRLSKKSNGKWAFTGHKGYVCFLCDSKGVYHFKLFRSADLRETFSVQLADSLKYKKLTEHFYYFNSSECMCGFNLVNTDEASKFSEIVCQRLPKKIPRKSVAFDESNERRGSMLGFSFFGKANKGKKKNKRSSRSKKNSRLSKGKSKSKSKLFRSKSKKKRYSKKSQEKSLWFNPDDVTPEWISILKKAGLKKKDLKDPAVQEKLRQVLLENNVSVEPPPAISDQKAREVYNKEDFEKYQAYKEEKAAYEKALVEYEKDLAEYNGHLADRQSIAFLDELEATPAAEHGSSLALAPVVLPSSSKRNLPRVSPVATTPPPVPKRKKRGARVAPPVTDVETVLSDKGNKPVFYASPPTIPALPPIEVKQDIDLESALDDFLDDEKFSVVRTGSKSKLSKVQTRDTNITSNGPSIVQSFPNNTSQQEEVEVREEKPVFLKMLIAQKKALTRTSALPDINTMKESQQGGILSKLKEALQSRRQNITITEDEEESSDWSEDA